MQKLRVVIREELSGFHGKLFGVKLLLALLPKYVGGRLRVRLLRLAGFAIGQGTIMMGTPLITGGKNLYKHLSIGENCFINIKCHFDVSAPVAIGDRVSIGHEVLVMTHTHQIETAVQRAGELIAHPIKIGSGTWLGARCTILPGVTVGEGAIVAAGAMVTKDVPPHTVAAGVPAKILRHLDQGMDMESSANNFPSESAQ
ncbi:MAG: acyltransferase [Chloroflexi bacterium]|nr:acyltransferase [Chloroflexota bacterium]